VIVPKAGETIPPPKEDPAKKMPVAPGGTDAPAKNVQIINPASIPAPVQQPALQAYPVVPAPGIAPPIPGQERPF
jgi:hypothetical protein